MALIAYYNPKSEFSNESSEISRSPLRDNNTTGRKKE